NGSGLGGHGVEIVDETVGEEGRAEAASLIPLWRLGVDILKGFAPVFFHAESHGVRQKFFEHFGSLDHAIETIGFDVNEEILEAENAFESTGAALGTRGHEPAEGADDE